jgi:hypothetical protein
VTREQLDAIRARLTFEYGPHTDVREILHAARDLHALLAEVEGLRESCTGLVKQNERQYDEVLRLTAERDTAFARGVAAMREAAAQRCEISPIHGEKTTTARKYADAVRSLPDPEDER